MSKAKQNDKVAVHYTGKLDDGSIFDSSRDREPLEFTIGGGQIIAGFEEGVLGMAVGESKTITINPENGYGDAQEDLIIEIDRNEIPEDIEVKEGLQLQMNQPDGEPVVVVVTKVTKDKVILDANHPLAGKTLTFEIELMKIA